ncbi:elongation factor P maturation arginine rhamnosyltransferase EarP [Entomospira culicis]|uniref:Protein-arginine rhamnosyltransferase n=1 Tax=Entomospira culicis TaxID=2719989 RepID=A0A968GHI6_9SPIO|nr:elongation factor P maturation arginine rhamnosyltransferase EarP [Entomospira culicis]NIZ19732.1 elongation factor P maturation arginine rhamnosyltransferase EarP [Entomospira culicis]NIZ69946.1 elongation factor P maturation arginine rhamnosyltransferase EarP [Entomospira culicis]WDI38680.1 elongation factor P maturation arginine rhamnosyltransferase EarP [Entomospira culicis]
MNIDLFCQVIDYFGDVAVTYRLARALKQRKPSLTLRFYCTHPDLVLALHPTHDQQSIALLPYTSASGQAMPADVAIEAFACTLPQDYPLPPIIINLEYLTAESWINDYHGLESFGMNPAGKKFFFFPSFTAQGSLTHGDFIEEKEIVQRHPSLTKKELSVELDLPKSYLSRPWLLLYLYEINETFLHQLLDHFAIIQIGASPTTIEDAWLVKRRCSQAIFDRLLLVADALFIRGEDSLSRAVLAGKPFLWQAYRQEEEYHHVKVHALNDHLADLYAHPDHQHWATLQAKFNRENCVDLAEFFAISTTFFTQMSNAFCQMPSLEVNLLQFIHTKGHHTQAPSR